MIAVLGSPEQKPSARAWGEAILAALGEGEPLEDDALNQLEEQVTNFPFYDWPPQFGPNPVADLCWIWEQIYERYPDHPRVQARYAEHLFHGSDDDQCRQALKVFYRAVTRDPEVFMILAADAKGEAEELGRTPGLASSLPGSASI